ncbi:MAG: MFS transporter [Methanobacteriota archaeon]|nr:MAG: MFS transporter [Euryarchaeota archaeon]
MICSQCRANAATNVHIRPARAGPLGMGRPPSNRQKWFYAYLPNGMAGGATSPLIPLFTRILGGSVADVGAVAAASSIASVPAFIGWGNLSDRLHRRKAFVLVGFLGTALSLLLMGLSRDVPDFYLANLLAGVLGAASAPVGTVLILETTQREGWASRIAVFSRIGGIGWITGLVLGVAWLEVAPLGESGEMRSLFVIGAALALLSGLLAWRWIGDPAETVERKHLDFIDLHWRVEQLRYLPTRVLHLLDFRRHLGRPRRYSAALYRYLATVFLLFSGFTAFYAIFPVYLRDVAGLSTAQIFAVFIASQAASAIAYGRVGGWIRARGGRRVQLVASAGRAILFPAFLAVPLFPGGAVGTFVLILAFHGLVGLCWAAINVAGSTIVSELAPSGERSGVMGAFNAVQGFGAILGPLSGGFVTHLFGFSAGIFASSAFIVAGILLLAASG